MTTLIEDQPYNCKAKVQNSYIVSVCDTQCKECKQEEDDRWESLRGKGLDKKLTSWDMEDKKKKNPNEVFRLFKFLLVVGLLIMAFFLLFNILL